MLKTLFAILLLAYATAAMALPFGSRYAIVVDEDTGKVLLEKDAESVTPIASLTKLMTAMVVLDSKPNMEEPIHIDQLDVDTIKHSASHVPVGVTLPRKTVLQLALMSSDNRAAAALARTYVGGRAAFIVALHAKLNALGMTHTSLEEPTGLSSNNTSTAADLVKMAVAASKYPDIARITTDQRDIIDIKGRSVEYHNTNRMVGQKGWNILLSKTGFINEAGRCIIMRFKSAGKNIVMVLLDAKSSSIRTLDALNIRHLIAGDAPSIRQARRYKRVRHYAKNDHRQRRHFSRTLVASS